MPYKPGWGRLKHQLGDANARLLTAGKAANWHIQVLRLEEELLRPGRDVQVTVAVDHRFAVGAERFL